MLNGKLETRTRSERQLDVHFAVAIECILEFLDVRKIKMDSTVRSTSFV